MIEQETNQHDVKAVEVWEPEYLETKDVKYATWIAFFAWVFAVYDFILFGTLLPVMGGHFSWNAAQQAEIATWVAFGGAIVAFVVGPVVDRIGRKKGIILTVGGAALCSLLTAVSAGMGKVSLVVVRSVAGLGFAEEGVNAAYLTEIYSLSNDPLIKKRRGLIYSMVQSGWPVGALLAAALTALLLPHIGWQGCFIFAAIPAFAVAIFAYKLKESPLFQVHEKIVQLRKAGDVAQAKTLADRFHMSFDEHSSGGGIAAAFKGSALRPTLVLSLAFLLNWSAIQVFSVLGTSVIIHVHNLSFENSLWILVLSNLVGFVGYIFHGWAGDRFGRRTTVALGWICGGIAFYGMLNTTSSIIPVVALYSIGLFFLIGPYSAMLFFMGESFPTSIRATAGAIVHTMGPIGAIIAGFGITSVLNSGGEWHTAALYFGALMCFLSGIVMFAVPHVDPHSVK